MNEPEFHTTWIFAAIYATGEDEISLSRLIGSADGLNHAIPTEEEICSALSFLESHELVKITNKKIFTTKYGKDLFKFAEKRRGNWFKTPEKVLFVFNKNLDYSKSLHMKEYKFINQKSLDLAYEDYVGALKSS
ncbi:MAG: hypothetical protein KUF75_02010 [Candidatus Thiodiazotropha sp. (ex Ctena orbiculata)]|nr:hypothetical protein [Candidatus Thiodiazotropha sp. (ex Codakia orbicularis)]MBV2123905.1 hypothetical protein [Candidatus Thiodiazotropha taylori]